MQRLRTAEEDAGRRLRLMADAYGLTERERLDIIAMLAIVGQYETLAAPSALRKSRRRKAARRRV